MNRHKILRSIRLERPIRNSEQILRYNPEGRGRPWKSRIFEVGIAWLLIALVIKRFHSLPRILNHSMHAASTANQKDIVV